MPFLTKTKSAGRSTSARETVQVLERRQLLTAAPLLLSGGNTANTFYLRENPNHINLDVWINSTSPGTGTPSQSLAISSITTVAISGGVGNDTGTVDFSNGDPFPSTVSFNGSNGSNAMIVTGLNGTAVFIGASTVTFGTTVISYSGTQSLLINGSAANDTLTQTAQPTAFVTFNGGGGSDSLNVSAGAFTFAGNPVLGTSNLTINDNSAVYFAAGAAGTGFNVRQISALNVGAGASALVDAPASSCTDRSVLVVGSLAINATGRLDLSTNDLIVRNGSLPAIDSLLTTGDAGGTWKGAGGITSSAAVENSLMALGVMQNASHGVPIYTSFDGQTVGTTDVLVGFTFVGDANLDGQVDGSDYTLIDNGFNTKASGWIAGDFNYDLKVDGSDYTLIDNAYNTQAAPGGMFYKLENALDIAQQQSVRTVAEVGTSGLYPEYTNADGSWAMESKTNWTAGMWPGLLWEQYAETGNPYFLNEATAFTNPLSVDQTQTSDVGFRVYDSFYPLLQTNPSASTDASIIQIMLNTAASKATQYNATVGAFKGWRASTSGNPDANFNVLMDLIMDSSLMFWAAKQSGNQTWYNETVQNAIVEEKYLMRSDGGSAQFAYFDDTTGDFVDNETYQGYNASSTWSRGEAWAIYGFTLCAQQTGSSDFLGTAEEAANYFLSHLPADNVPYWDFNDPSIPDTYRDSSAAAVAASGLLNLSKLIATSDPANSARYRNGAASILASLTTSTYMNPATTASNGLLLQGAENVPATPSINDSAILFGDYFFLQAANTYLAG